MHTLLLGTPRLDCPSTAVLSNASLSESSLLRIQSRYYVGVIRCLEVLYTPLFAGCDRRWKSHWGRVLSGFTCRKSARGMTLGTLTSSYLKRLLQILCHMLREIPVQHKS